jgi:hypothetical protein
LRRTLTDLHRANIKPGLLIGESEWSDPVEAEPMAEAIWMVARWNKAHPEATFSEVHLDIEPQSRTSFSMDPQGTIKDWQQSHQIASDIGEALGIPLSLSIATTATLQVTSTSLAIPPRLAHRFSAVSLMAYRRQFDGDNGSWSMVTPVLHEWQEQNLPPRRVYLGVELTTATASLHHAAISTRPPRYPDRIPTELQPGSSVHLSRPGALWALSISRRDGLHPATDADWHSLLSSVGFEPTRDPQTLRDGLLWLRESGEFFEGTILPAEDRPTTAPRLIAYRYRMPASVSLHGQSPFQIADSIAAMEARLSDYPAFAGIAIHDFGELNRLTGTNPQR